VALLRDLGLLEEAGRGTYQLGWRAVQLGHAAMETAGVLPIAEPVMRRLVAQTDESVTVFRRVELEMEVIGQIESPHVMRLTFHPGQRLKLSAGASARVLLSGVPDDGLEEVLDGLCAVDPSFRARRAEFAADVRRTRERGWTTSREEIDSGVWAVAAPLHVDGRVVASLAVAGPLHRHDADAERRTVELLRQAAAEIDRALAARGVS
jgi:DNA-binding IclR family transcriptional regulator